MSGEIVDEPGVVRVVVVGGSGGNERGEKLLTVFERGNGDGMGILRHGNADHAQPARGFGRRNPGSAIRPAAAESNADAHAEFVRGVRGETNHAEKFRRKEFHVPNSLLRVVERKRIDGLDLDAPDAAGLHRVQFARQFIAVDGGTKPPPARHGTRIGMRAVRLRSKAALQGGERIGRGGRAGPLRMARSNESQADCITQCPTETIP